MYLRKQEILMTAQTGYSRTRSIVICGLSVALLAVSAMISVPLGPVPFTLQTAILVLIVCIMTPGEAAATVGAYLVLGAIGLPIFSGFRGGFGVIAGPTGGFLVGFFIGAVIAVAVRQLIVRKGNGSKGRMLAGDIVAALLLEAGSYVCGIAWLMISAHMDFAAACMVGLVPFIIPDIVKVVAAIAIARPVRKALGRN